MSTARKRTPKRAVPAKVRREPTARESAAIAEAKEGQAVRPVRPGYTEAPDAETGQLCLDSPHADPVGHFNLVSELFGTSSDDFVGAAMMNLANLTLRDQKPSLQSLNASLALIGAIAPENELEAALATQMAATHELALEMARRAKLAETRDGVREYGNLATKMQRTFTAQIKALSDWRRGGEQVVRHIHVSNGGQAVVAETVNIGGCRNEEISNRGHEPFAALPCADSSRDALPVSGDGGQEALLPARRRAGVRRAKRKQER